MDLIFATHNKNKALEVEAKLAGRVNIQTLSELNLKEEIPETGDTLEANALIKARYVFGRWDKPCFADDTGLEVDALEGAPGVYSARYAGEPSNSENNMEKLLKALYNVSNRSARFRTVIAYIDKSGREYLFEGIVKGFITKQKSGTKGFGYDPVFIPEGYGKTFAEMTREEKNTISHRALAVEKFTRYLLSQKN